MPVKKNRKKYCCSACGQAGHDRRSCPEKRSIGQSVWVNFARPHSRSPHLVDLRPETENTVFKEVEAFTELRTPHRQREVVDFAAMVRLANQKRLKEIPPLPRVEKKIVAKERPKKDWAVSVKSWSDKGWDKMFGWKINWVRFAYASVAACLLVAVPFPAIGYYQKLKVANNLVVEQSTNAFLALQSSTVAAFNADFVQAQTDLNLALDAFGQTENLLEKDYQALVYVASLLPVVGKQVSSRQNLLQAGHHLALGNTYLVKGVGEVSGGSAGALTDQLAIFRNHLQGALPEYEKALEDLGAIDSQTIPVEYQQSFGEFQILFATFVDDLQDLISLIDSLNLVFGSQDFRRYLIVFQNNHELRPTGGFMGSYAILDVQKGKILNLDIPGGGTYAIQGQLDKYLKPPLPLQLVNDRWEFQDANWFPDFAVSAQKISWFYQHGRQVTVDGVIAINASILERLLSVIGPVSHERLGEVDQTNVLASLQVEVEAEENRATGAPKAILSDLAGQFFSRLQNLDKINLVRLLTELNAALAEKEIQVYFKDEFLERKMAEFGVTGELATVGPNQDYLFVVNTNIRGLKSDAKIQQQIEHQAVIQEDGTVVDTVVIKRTHLGEAGEKYYGNDNIDYVRLYVPAGAELIAAGGFSYPPEEEFSVPEDWYEDDDDLSLYEKEEAVHAQTGTRITREFSKTAFGNWLITQPGETSAAYFTYRLPFSVLGQEDSTNGLPAWAQALVNQAIKPASRYSLYVQKQSGIKSDFSTTIIYPNGWQPVWSMDSELDLAQNGASQDLVLATDHLFGLVMEKIK
ncbi:MAG TPA: DUF4012 domain-containing protein [Patescibacteria group bacterium]|nr:DUF4012 domain-containing protein [Patescibacteria group bacterium]